MIFYRHATAIEAFEVNTDVLECVTTLHHSKHIHNHEEALRELDPAIGRAFSNFSPDEIRIAIAEARGGVARALTVLEARTGEAPAAPVVVETAPTEPEKPVAPKPLPAPVASRPPARKPTPKPTPKKGHKR